MWKIASVLMVSLVAFPVDAETFPSKSIRMLVPFAPGGATDTFARVLGAQVSERLGQQVVIENRPGAGTTIAAELVAKAAPDGHTLLFTDMSTHAITASLYKKLSYDPVKSFSAVALAASSPMMLVAHPSFNVKSIPQLIATAKKHREIPYGSSGNGTVTHLAVESLKTRTGIDLVHVPFKGGTSSVTSVLTGDIAVAIATIPAVLPFVNDHRLVALAVTSAKRAPQLPQIPAVAETVSGFNAAVINGVLVPARTTKEVVNLLNGEFNRAGESPRAKEIFSANAAEAVKISAAELQDMLARDVTRWAEVVRVSGAQVN
ncbi:MAG TPA: tripartite tricarboxylate transporter substrate-binding protein [Burkholderiales bacterium]|nr:tripartite tricarboxylate transporter substrate-binding protein [Burkholderiales bacterium]